MDNRTDYERFWSKVVKTNTCWLYNAGLDKQGYGQFYITIDGIGKTVKAHRFAWELQNGPIPDGMSVLHHCDTPNCVNYESHLFLGTILTNNRYKIKKGRAFKGHLSDDQVKYIRLLYAEDYTQTQICNITNIPYHTIHKIVHNFRYVGVGYV